MSALPVVWLSAGAAGALSAGAVVLGLPDAARDARLRLGAAGLDQGPPTWSSRPRVGQVAACAALVVAALATSPGAAIACAVAGLAAVVWHRQRLVRRREAGARELVVALVPAIAAELRGGQPPGAALAAAVAFCATGLGDSSVLTALLDVPSDGDSAEVSAALSQAGQCPGAHGLARLAVCWAVTGTTGAGLATAVDRIGAALRADEGIRRAAQSELAAPRATAVLLAALPAAGLLVGTLAGARPAQLLLETWWGRGCLAAGLVLEASGLWWVTRLAASASRDVA